MKWIITLFPRSNLQHFIKEKKQFFRRRTCQLLFIKKLFHCFLSQWARSRFYVPLVYSLRFPLFMSCRKMFRMKFMLYWKNSVVLHYVWDVRCRMCQMKLEAVIVLSPISGRSLKVFLVWLMVDPYTSYKALSSLI